jgi:DNA polymerase elongation subunit (family B)
MQYCLDDVTETRAISNLLSRSSFLQAQILPYSYQNVSVRGNATKIDALLLREYLRAGHSVPSPPQARGFAGGYTDMFVEGVVKNVHHCDVRSLYPSLMLTREIAPSRDVLGVFLKLLDALRRFRLDAKSRMRESASEGERIYYDALQTTFKILINSFYGYLGFGQARFADFDAASKVTEDGRALLREMVDWLRSHGAQPVEIDTDGIYFVPPAGRDAEELRQFREAFAASLPEGIEIEFDGEYVSMYSYKMKNYALLTDDGEVIVKGAALKSRGLEPFQREFLGELLRMRLEGRESELPGLKRRYEEAIRERRREVSWYAKSERLQDSPATYVAKREKGKRAKSAAYELALKSDREFRAGDQLSFYVTGNKKSVSVHEVAKLTSEWDKDNRDENVPYYLAKLESLCKKFDVGSAAQGQLGL